MGTIVGWGNPSTILSMSVGMLFVGAFERRLVAFQRQDGGSLIIVTTDNKVKDVVTN